MEITAKLVKDLREITSAGMMECKKALQEVNGDMEKAIEFLREKGLAKAAKKANKVAAEGLITLVIDENNTKAALTEVNSQTDFVAKNENFVALTKKVTEHIFNNEIKNLEELNKSTIDGTNFEEFLKLQISSIGENIVVRRLAFAKACCENSIVCGYVHFNKKVGVILKANCDSEATKKGAKDLLQNVCMHISAMKPQYLSYKDLDVDFVEKEYLALKGLIEKENEELVRLGKQLKRIPKYASMSQITEKVLEDEKELLKEELKKQGKPEKIWDKILPGQIERFIQDNTLIDQQYALFSQQYVLDDNKTVLEAVNDKAKELGGNIEIVEYTRFEVGEGLEKKEENFAEEVAKQMGL